MGGLGAVLDSAWGWVIAGAVLMLLEIFATGVFLFWIGLGAAITGLTLMLAPTLPLWARLLVFIVATLLSVGVGIRASRRSKARSREAGLNAGLSTFVGHSAVVAEVFAQGQLRVRLQDTTYNAHCPASPEALRPGDVVRIVRVREGNVLEVVPAEVAGLSAHPGS